MDNVAIFGGSTFAGPRQFIKQTMLNERGQGIMRNSKIWRLQHYPVLPAPSAIPVEFNGLGAVGGYLEPGLWSLLDQNGGTIIFEAPPLPQARIILLRGDLHTDMSHLWRYDLEDEGLSAVSVGGGPLPIISRGKLNSSGSYSLAGLPEGIHAIFKYKKAIEKNIWILSFGQDGADQITMTASPVPTKIIVSDKPTDIIVEDGDGPITIKSLDSKTGIVELSKVPNKIPIASYWALIGEVFG